VGNTVPIPLLNSKHDLHDKPFESSSWEIHWLDGRSTDDHRVHRFWLWHQCAQWPLCCAQRWTKVVRKQITGAEFHESGMPNFNCKFYLEWCWQYCQKKCVLESLWEACPTRGSMGTELVPSCWVGLDSSSASTFWTPPACSRCIRGSNRLICISRLISYLQRDYYIAYHYHPVHWH